MWSIIICSYWIVPLMALCPVPTHYPLSCSACLSFSEHVATQSAADHECQSKGGALVTVSQDLEWEILQLYLESFNLSTTRVWVGYRLGEEGEMSGEAWNSAPSALVESMKRSLAARGSEAECVTVQEGEMMTTHCSKQLVYVCVFSYPAPSLVVSYPPPGNVYHSPSLTLSLEAFISASGITSIGWRRLDNAIDPTSNWVLSKKKMGQDKMWVMLNVSSENSEDYEGFYELLVTNPAGETVVATWSVQPASLGSFTQSPQDLTVPQGSIAFFECSADDALPAPSYTWFKGENPVVQDSIRIYVSNVTHTLLMRDVGPEDAGAYSCRVENSAGAMTSPPATLTIRPQQEFESLGPQILLQPRNTTLQEGSIYSLECIFLHTSSDFSYIMVLPDMGISMPFQYPTASGTPSLTLPVYESTTSVCYGGDANLTRSRFGYVTVNTSPRAKIVSSFGSNTSILENTNASLECSFGGIPIPSMFWYQNGVAVGDRPIRALRVSGVYQCLISNQYDTIISTIVICVQNLPGSTPFSVVADSTTSLYVTWSPPQPPSVHPLLLRYEILTTHTLTNVTSTSGTLLPSSSPWVVEGLNSSSEYRVRVSSWSPLGQGADGQEQTAYTYGPAPQKSPLQYLNITVSVNQGLVVEWYPTLPPPPGTVFAYYQVQYRTIGEEGEGLTETVDTGQSWVLIDQLENAHNYEIRLGVKVQVQRFPAEYEDTPWSVWMPVEGVTTLPTGVEGVTTLPTEAVEESDREEVLLVWVLVPVLGVVVLVALLVPVAIIVWRFWTRHTQSYSPRDEELRQVPMRNDVFSAEENLN